MRNDELKKKPRLQIHHSSFRIHHFLNRHDVVAAVHVQDFARYAGGEGAEEEERGVADLARFDVAPERRALGVVSEPHAEVAAAPPGERVDGAGAGGVDEYVAAV